MLTRVTSCLAHIWEIVSTFFYQNVRGLKTKNSDVHDSVSCTEDNVIFLTAAELNDYFCHHNLQFYEKLVWVELPTPDGENVLTGSHDFPPDALPNTTLNRLSYFSSENEPETKSNRVILMGDFNTPGLTGNAGSPYQIFIIILNLQEILYTPLRVFSDQHTAQELAITPWCLTLFSLL